MCQPVTAGSVRPRVTPTSRTLMQNGEPSPHGQAQIPHPLQSLTIVRACARADGQYVTIRSCGSSGISSRHHGDRGSPAGRAAVTDPPFAASVESRCHRVGSRAQTCRRQIVHRAGVRRDRPDAVRGRAHRPHPGRRSAIHDARPTSGYTPAMGASGAEARRRGAGGRILRDNCCYVRGSRLASVAAAVARRPGPEGALPVRGQPKQPARGYA
jgi:hypothetical protein